MKKKNKIAVFAVMLMIISTFFTACEEISSAPVITEPADTNYPVSIGSLEFETAPQSVVSLSPAITEIIFELGYNYSLVGVGEYCDFPEQALKLNVAGSAANPDIDEIIKLSPELLISQSPIAKKDIVSLEDAGIRVLILGTPKSYDELKQNYMDISALFGGNDNAETKVNAAFEALDEQIELAKGADISFVYIMSYGTAAATPDTLAGSILSIFGKNIAKKYTDCEMPVEEIIAADPEYLFLALPRNALNLPDGLKDLPAVQEGRIVSMFQDLFDRPTTRIVESLINANVELGLFDEPEETTSEEQQTPDETIETSDE